MFSTTCYSVIYANKVMMMCLKLNSRGMIKNQLHAILRFSSATTDERNILITKPIYPTNFQTIKQVLTPVTALEDVLWKY